MELRIWNEAYRQRGVSRRRFRSADLPHEQLEYAVDALVESDALGERPSGMPGRLVLGAWAVGGAQVGLEDRNAGAVVDVRRAARALAFGARRGREADDANRAGFGEEFGDLRHAAHVLTT